MSDETLIPPPVMWAQRAAVVFLTINVEDIKDSAIKFDKQSVYFKGTGGVDEKTYEVIIPLFKEIDLDKSKYFNRGRCIEIVLAKKNEEESYWSSLTSDKAKHHWLKCDFNKWQDEDESGDEGLGGMGGGMGGGGDFEEMMRQMGGLGGAGGGAGGGGGAAAAAPYFDGAEDDNEQQDSDDEPLPDLE